MPIISRATHFGGLNGTCIDNIISNDISRVINTGLIRCNISRHLPTFVIIDSSVDGTSNNRSKNRVKVNDYLLNCFLQEFESLETLSKHIRTIMEHKFQYIQDSVNYEIVSVSLYLDNKSPDKKIIEQDIVTMDDYLSQRKETKICTSRNKCSTLLVI